MKLPDTRLHELIRRMGGAEKRYFKLFASLHRRKRRTQSVALFEAIAKQKKYDEVALKKKIPARTSTYFFEKAKRDLYDLIMRSLRNFHEKKYDDTRLANSLFDVRILLDKGLFHNAQVILNKSRKEALKGEYYWLLLRIREQKIYTMLNREYFPFQDEEMIDDTFREFFTMLDDYGNIMRYYKGAFTIINSILKEGFARRIEHPKIEQSAKFMSVDVKALSARSKLYYYLFWCLYYFGSDEYQRSFDFAAAAIEFMRNNPLPQEYGQFQYQICSYYLNNCIFLKQYEHMPVGIRQLKEIKTNSTPLKKNIEGSALNMTASYFIRMGDFAGAKAELVPSVKEPGQPGDFGLTLRLLSYYHMSIVYFGIGDLKKSAKWLNDLINSSLPGLGLDLLIFARIFQLVVYYELDYTDLVESRTRSLYRYLLKNKRLFRFENCLLNFIRKELVEVNNRKDLMAALSRLHKQLTELFDDPFEQKALVYFDYIMFWLESKIESRAFADVVRANRRK